MRRKKPKVEDDPLRTEMLRLIDLLGADSKSPEFAAFAHYYTHDFADGKGNQEELQRLFLLACDANGIPSLDETRTAHDLVRRKPS